MIEDTSSSSGGTSNKIDQSFFEGGVALFGSGTAAARRSCVCGKLDHKTDCASSSFRFGQRQLAAL